MTADESQLAPYVLSAIQQATRGAFELAEAAEEIGGGRFARAIDNREVTMILADALKLTLEAKREAGGGLREEENQMLDACEWFLDGWLG